MSNERLVERMKAEGSFSSRNIEKAFLAIDRGDFVRTEDRGRAYPDYPLQIGYGQTISQPSMVAIMLQLLSVEPGHKLLDVGTGSGWTTALLSHLVGKKGKVIGVERIPELVKYGRQNLKKYNPTNASIIESGKGLGFAKEAPYDRILVSAEPDHLPQQLVKQLKQNGRMVIPINGVLYVVDKKSEKDVEIIRSHGVIFVPLIEN